VRRRLKEQGGRHVDEAAIFDAYTRMRQMEQEAAATSKAARRNEQRRRTHAADGRKKPDGDLKINDGMDSEGIQPFDEIEVLP
jgi:putative transposase